jgi:hypothetical protein
MGSNTIQFDSGLIRIRNSYTRHRIRAKLREVTFALCHTEVRVRMID